MNRCPALNRQRIDLRACALSRTVARQRLVPHRLFGTADRDGAVDRRAHLFRRGIDIGHVNTVRIEESRHHGASRVDHDEVFNWGAVHVEPRNFKR